MSLQYLIYSGDNSGGEIDYSTPVATVSGTSTSLSALPLGSRTRFGVRAHDTVTGLTEQNVDAQVEIVVDGSGNDISAVPLPVQAPGARAGQGGSVVLTWSYPYPSQPHPPTGFHVYQGTGTVSFVSPVQTVTFHPGQTRYRTTITGLSDGVAYLFTVRAFNGTGEEASTATVGATAVTTPPANVANLTATLVP